MDTGYKEICWVFLPPNYAKSILTVIKEADIFLLQPHIEHNLGREQGKKQGAHCAWALVQKTEATDCLKNLYHFCGISDT